jgi:conjugal transfer/type IV secretion protein DotA/TraY
MAIMEGVTKGQVFRYVFLPEILPRLHAFTHSGFSHLAGLIAQVYGTLNLLPKNHPALLPQNRSSLSLRYVIKSAAQQLKFDKSHIDQIILFALILVGLALLALQFITLLAFIMMRPAFAQDMPQQYGDFFMDADPKHDIAYRMLFTVFGIPELFKEGGARSEYHIALHSLFQFYSIGILVIAVIFISYYIFAILAETAQTGVPFGKRYNHVWTPIRLVFALGLLIPVGYGLNSAQWITLYTAKFGSDFATKGWVLFNETMNGEYIDDAEKRIGTPKAPNLQHLPAFMMNVAACKYAYSILSPDIVISAHEINTSAATQSTYAPGLDGFNDSYHSGKYDRLIRFGELNPEKYPNEIGKVKPYCGEIVISKTDNEPGSKYMQQAYWDIIMMSMYSSGSDLSKYAKGMVDKYMEYPNKTAGGQDPPDDFKARILDDLHKKILEEIDEAVRLQTTSKSWENNLQDVKKYGWGGAGIWYNKIAQINGSLVTAVNTAPQIRGMPMPLENICREVLQQNRNVGDCYKGSLSNNLALQGENINEKAIGEVLQVVYNYWQKDDPSQGSLSQQTKMTGNIIIDAINAIFGTQGLFAMCQNTDTHPLAQLSILGKGLVEASIRNIMGGVGFGVVNALLPNQIGAFMGAASGMLFSIASITIVMGFMLFYVLPFMPFLYFFFAVGGWIKGLFEAMVGMPLWALAHLRIDGEGLPGSAGADGYYLILEIFIRPILIVFGLLASVIIFAAMVKVLNEIFHIVVQNLSGHDPTSTAICGKTTDTGGTTTTGSQDPVEFFRGPIDELFYTVLYAIIVYMIGMSCFKLIDLVPNNILRYMGSNASAFNDKQGDPADGLMQRLSFGGSVISGKILGPAGEGLVQSMTKGTGQAVQGVSQMAAPPPPPPAPSN